MIVFRSGDCIIRAETVKVKSPFPAASHSFILWFSIFHRLNRYRASPLRTILWNFQSLSKKRMLHKTRARNARPYGYAVTFLQRCRGAHRAPADIIQTFNFSPQRPPSSREGDRPVGGGRSSQALEGVHPHRFYAEHPSTFRCAVGIRGTRSI